MISRSANSTIKGYEYQFLSTIKELLLCKKASTLFTIEGIEDLDINSLNENSLCQYKYYESQTYQPSKFSKPIAYFFSHFYHYQQDKYKYNLFIFIKSDVPNIHREELKHTLSLSEGTKVLLDNGINLDNINDDTLDKFLTVFCIIKCCSYSTLQSEIKSLLSTTYNVSIKYTEFFFLPNALQKIHDLAILDSIDDRNISKGQFSDFLTSAKHYIDIETITTNDKFRVAKREIYNHLKNINVYKNSSHIFVVFPEMGVEDVTCIMLHLSKKFFYKSNSTDNKPITFVIESAAERINIKKELYKKIASENIELLMNDGFEELQFVEKIFNMPPYSINKPQKIEHANYNFRVISSTKLNQTSQTLTNNNFFFCIKNAGIKFQKSDNFLNLVNFNREQIIEIIGDLK